MVVVDVLERFGDVAQRPEYVHADPYVLLNVQELVGGERAGFVQDVLANADLPDVVQPAGEAHVLHHIGVKAELLGHGRRLLGHAL